VDILIMILLLVLALLVWRGANRGVVIALWVVGLVATIGLFRYHVTSMLDLSF
jgi:multisubunit Na+/H+ antiporter MnhF subunit